MQIKPFIKQYVSKYGRYSFFSTFINALYHTGILNSTPELLAKTNLTVLPSGWCYCPWLDKRLIDISRKDLPVFLSGLEIKSPL